MIIFKRENEEPIEVGFEQDAVVTCVKNEQVEVELTNEFDYPLIVLTYEDDADECERDGFILDVGESVEWEDDHIQRGMTIEMHEIHMPPTLNDDTKHELLMYFVYLLEQRPYVVPEQRQSLPTRPMQFRVEVIDVPDIGIQDDFAMPEVNYIYSDTHNPSTIDTEVKNYCTNCGQRLQSDWNFCISCGKRI